MIENITVYLLMAVLLFLSAFFSGVETAFTSLSMIQAEKLSKEPFIGKFVKKIASNKKKLIITVLISNNIVNILLSVITTAVFMKVFGDSAIAIITGILTFMLLFFGEITPKTYAHAHNEKIVRLTAVPIFYLQKVLTPVSWFFEVMSKFLLFRQKKVIGELFGDRELATVLDIGVSQESFTDREKDTILKFLNIDDTPAKRIMTHLGSVFALDLHMKVKNVLPLIKKERFSRVPLYDKEKSNIMGFIHIKDISDLKKEDEEKELYLFSRGVIKMSEARAVSDVFKEMLNFHTHIAVVVRDNKALGIITLEDVLEEFIGEIYDEKDRVNPDNFHMSTVMQKSRRQYVVEGSCPVSRAEIILKHALPKKREDETIEEMLLSFIKDPKPRMSIGIGGVLFRVMSVEKGRITKVKLISHA